MRCRYLTVAIPFLACVLASGFAEGILAAEGAGLPAKADRPDIKLGDRWKFACAEGRKKSDRLWVVTSVDSTGVKGKWNSESLALTSDLNVIESPEDKNSDKRLLSFPLEVGKHWSANNNFVDHTNKDVTGSEKYTVAVTGAEKVKVQAGEFDAFKLKAKSYWSESDGGIGAHEFTYWYAPAAKAVVKESELVTWATGSSATTCELVEFQLQP